MLCQKENCYLFYFKLQYRNRVKLFHISQISSSHLSTYMKSKILSNVAFFRSFFSFFQTFLSLQEQGVAPNSNLRLKAWFLAVYHKKIEATFGRPVILYTLFYGL